MRRLLVKPEIKAIITDLDGTLLTKKRKLLNETRRALIKAQEQGYRLILASSRSYFMMEEIVKELKLAKYDGYAICMNGMEVVRVQTQEVFRQEDIKPWVVRDYLELAKKESMLAVFESYRGMQLYMPLQYKLLTPVFTFLTAKKLWSDFRKINFTVYADFRFSKEQNLTRISSAEQLNYPVLKLGLMHLYPGIERYHKIINRELGDELQAIRISRVWLDVMPKGVSKASGVDLIKDRLGYGLESMIAFGDAENDVEMICRAQIGIAMANAMDIVKEVADDVTRSHQQNGIAYALNKHLGIFNDDFAEY